MNFPPKIVDLKASEIDMEKSDPKTGKYVFKTKKYIDYKGVKANRPPWRFAWCYKSEYDLEDWKRKWPGTELVKVGDPYWPEGFAPDSEGHYSYKDVVLVKIPLKSYLEKRKEEIMKSERATQAIVKQLMDEFGQAGISEEEVQEMLGLKR